MIPALIAAILFAASVIAASRSSRLLGTQAANFWRIVAAVVLLGAWGHLAGLGLGGGALGIFFLSGVIGFGLGDFALFETLPRLGPRLTSLMVNCLAAPFAAAVEWLWLDTRLSGPQLACGLVILGGVALSLAPEDGVPTRDDNSASRDKPTPTPSQGSGSLHPPRSPSRPIATRVPGGHGPYDRVPVQVRWAGILFGVLAAFGQGLGAVLTRKAFAVTRAAGFEVDGGTAAYQRILGGLAFVAFPYGFVLLRRHWRAGDSARRRLNPLERHRAWAWVLGNALAGPSIGVAFYQWGLKIAPSGVVLPVTAMAPLLVVPFTYLFEGDRPSWRSLAGGVLAVAGVIGLAFLH